MPIFRPLPILSVFALAGLALLIALGNWQISRMSWKQDLITQFETRGAPVSLQAALCDSAAGEFRPAVEMPAPLLGAQLNMYAMRDMPGIVRIGAIEVQACTASESAAFLLIESGFELQADGSVRRPERWRLEPLPEPGFFTPGNDPDTNQWYGFDRIAMAEALDIAPEQMLEIWARSDDSLPASLSQTPPAKHFGYAITWYGLALALIAVYLALHLAQGRLRWR